MTYKIKCINSVRFMVSSLSRLAAILAEGLENEKCKDCKYHENVEVKDKVLIFKCLKYNTNKKHFHKDIVKRSVNTVKFCDQGINKFCLMLREGVYPYGYMDTWERLNETSLPDKKNVYSNLNTENITEYY